MSKKAIENLSQEELLKAEKAGEKLMQDGICVYFAKKRHGQNFIQVECPAHLLDTLDLPHEFTEYPYPDLFYRGRGGKMAKVASIPKNSVKKILLEMDMHSGKSSISVE